MEDTATGEFGATGELVRAAQDGSAEALEDLFARYLPRVRQIVALRMGQRLRQLSDVEDIVQEVLLTVLRGLERFESKTEGSFRHWLARCVERRMVDQIRDFGRHKRGAGRVRRFGDYGSSVLHVSIFPGREPTPSEVVSRDELAARLEDALLAMPDHHRELIVLRSLCGMSFAEVARELGIADEVTVRVAHSRALKKLKRLVDQG